MADYWFACVWLAAMFGKMFEISMDMSMSYYYLHFKSPLSPIPICQTLRIWDCRSGPLQSQIFKFDQLGMRLKNQLS